MLVLSACRDRNVVTASYATLAEAREAGAVASGWIPGGLPAGAHDLREAHDPGSNRRWGLFSFPKEQGDALRALLVPGAIAIAGLSCDVPSRVEWWPVILRGRLDETQVRATGLQAYRAKSGDLVFFVNWNQGRAYYWNPAS